MVEVALKTWKSVFQVPPNAVVALLRFAVISVLWEFLGGEGRIRRRIRRRTLGSQPA